MIGIKINQIAHPLNATGENYQSDLLPSRYRPQIL